MANNDVLTEESVLQLINQLVGIEAAARESADTQEIIDRQAADESLNQLVEQEIDARKAALSALQSTVNQSITRIDGNVTQLQNLFNQRFQTIVNEVSEMSASFEQKIALLDSLRDTILANQAGLAIVQGDESTDGSIAKALFDAKAYTDAKVSELLDNAPAVLDTLKELSDALGGDENFVTTINGTIATEASIRQQQVDEIHLAISALGGSIGTDLTEAIDDLQQSIDQETANRQGNVQAALAEAKAYSDTNKQQILDLLSQGIIKKQKIIISEEHIAQGYIELPDTNIVQDSLDAFIDRLGMFENEDFELLVVGETTRLMFINSFAKGGNEEIEFGSELRVKYWTI